MSARVRVEEMSDAPVRPAIWRRITLDLDAVTSVSDLQRFLWGADETFDNMIAVQVYVDSETGELAIEQKYV